MVIKYLLIYFLTSIKKNSDDNLSVKYLNLNML